MQSAAPSSGRIRIGGVSYLNAKPLLYGLAARPELSVELDVPSRLLEGLAAGRLDVALLPVIDYQRMANLRIVPAGGIGCDGATLTVRIFSPAPIEQIESLACDPDSHTSVALAQIILFHRHGIRPRLAEDGTARLLIGDKVVLHEPRDMPYQLDLGAAWKELTGLPFVFAIWTARAGVALGDLPNILESARRMGVAHIEEIVEREALPRGWPADLARRYLSSHLHFEIGRPQLEAMRRFYEMAAERRLIASPPREMRLAGR